MHSLSFFKTFAKSPTRVGAVWPSSNALGRMMVRDIGIEKANAVVEIGPGTGAVTQVILDAIPETAAFMTIEIDAGLHEIFQKRFPEVNAHNECASNIAEILEKENIKELDAVLSGLPWASFGEELQTKLMDAICDVLAPKGVFVTFAYVHGTCLPAAKRFKKTLEHRFSKVGKSPIVWGNIPPAFVYRCVR